MSSPLPALDARPRLAGKARLQKDRLGDRWLLLYPERGLLLNPTAAEILALCDGVRTVAVVVDLLTASGGASRAQVERDVSAFLSGLSARGLITWDAG